MTSEHQHLRLYLMRHGAVESTGRLIGHTDAALAVAGLAQAQQLAAQLATTKLSAVYASDLQRAVATATPIAARHNLPVLAQPQWREIAMGEWEGRVVAELHTECPERMAQCFSDPASFAYPGGEAFSSFAARVRHALAQLLAEHNSGAIALVVHGGVCRAILGEALGMPMTHWLRLAQDYGCLNVIDWYDDIPFVWRVNQALTEHTNDKK